MESKRVTIFTGNFGSGKTELSINYALKLKEQYSNVMLADLDVINPYFRSREKADFLEERGIKVIFPRELTHADLPIIPAEVHNIIQNKEVHGIMDVGGDDDGAIALGSVSRKLEKGDYEMNFVINTLRPFTSNYAGIKDMKERIEKTSKLEFNHIVCNINLGRETNVEHIKKGYGLVVEAAEKLNLPIKFIAVREELLPLPADFQPGEEIFPVKLFMNPPWIR